ncbi:MAG: hypothetical protein RLZZ142_1722 [Verrucomicrobiota bacterium]
MNPIPLKARSATVQPPSNAAPPQPSTAFLPKFVAFASLLLLILLASSAQAQPAHPLPRVLLIGDSISVGYTPFVQQGMADRARVQHAPGNNESTRSGLRYLDQWLGAEAWDVIHFNFGLHDLKYVQAGQPASDPALSKPWDPKRNPEKNVAEVSQGQQNVPVEEYEKNLHTLVERLQKTGARLVWCSTTPVPEGVKYRVPGDEQRYNAAARSVMESHGIPINDLWASCGSPENRLRLGGLAKDVHYKPEGSKALADRVIQAIDHALQNRRP